MFLTLIQFLGISLIVSSIILLIAVGGSSFLKSRKGPANQQASSTPSAELKSEELLSTPSSSSSASPVHASLIKQVVDFLKPTPKPQPNPTPISFNFSSTPNTLVKRIPQNSSSSSILVSPSPSETPKIPEFRETSDIFGFSPSQGQVGQEITIKGSGFGTTAKYVLFNYRPDMQPNGIEAKIVSWDKSKIVVKVPDQAVSGKIAVALEKSEVKNSYGDVAISSNEFTLVTRDPFPIATPNR